MDAKTHRNSGLHSSTDAIHRSFYFLNPCCANFQTIRWTIRKTRGFPCVRQIHPPSLIRQPAPIHQPEPIQKLNAPTSAKISAIRRCFRE
jgi:hypothetical protein